MAGASKRQRPHVLGIDDGPFVKGVSATVPIVGVMMAGADLVECVAMSQFPIDGEGVTDFLIEWVRGCRFRPSVQAIVLGGVTIAGLSVVEVERLAERLRSPVLVVNRRDPSPHRMRKAFASAGLLDRLALVEATPPATRIAPGLFVAAAGIDISEAARLLRAVTLKSGMPEPLRLAHLIAAAVVSGESRGRV